MRELLLTQGNLSRKLRQLLVLFTLILLPIGAWGQDPGAQGEIYNIYIDGGHLYEFSSIPGVSFAKTSENSGTLTLNGADIYTIESELDDLTIQLEGSSTIRGNVNAPSDPPISGNGGTITFEGTGSLTFSSTSSTPISGFSSVSFTNLGYYPSTKEIKSATTYPLWVGGMQVTSGNASNITGDKISGIVTYNENTSTLTLNGATIDGAIWMDTGTEDLTVALNGTCSVINTSGTYALYTNGGKFNFVKATGATSAKLTATCGNGYTPISFSSSSLGNGLYWAPVSSNSIIITDDSSDMLPAPAIALDTNTNKIAVTRNDQISTEIFYTWGDAEIGAVYTHEAEIPTLTTYSDNNKIAVQNGTLRAWVGYEYNCYGELYYVLSEAASQTFTVKKDIASCTVNLPESATYNGEAYEPVVDDGATATAPTQLTLGTDYTVSYQKTDGETVTNVNAMIDAGTYNITITGTGDYTGTKEVTGFQIGKANLADAVISKLIVGSQEYTATDTDIEIPYTGNAIQPSVVVKINYGLVTVDESDYSVSCTNNTNVSGPNESATLTITSTGKNFTSDTSKSLNFKIVPASVNITANDQTVFYNGQVQNYTNATVDNDYATLAIAYYTREEDRTKGSNALSGAPTNAGTYYVQVTQTNTNFVAEAKDATFTIEKADPELSFSSPTATITIGKEDEFIKPILTTTPEGLEVNYESANPDVALVNKTTGDITPVAVGENIEISATFSGNDNYNAKSASYLLTVEEIVKGTAEVTTSPTAKELTYTGEPQELINAGEATNGEMQYKLGADGNYSTDIPTGTDAIEYTVFYKAVATDTNLFNDSEEASITVTIEKADPVLQFSSATATITIGKEDEFIKPILTTTPEGLEVKYESGNTDVATVDETTGDITPVAVGENIEISATFAGNDNYYAKSASYLLTVEEIVKGTAEVTTSPTAKELTYTGEPQELINAGEATNGEMQYKLGADGNYSTDIPTGTDAIEYTVYYKAVATDTKLFNDSEEASITVTIEKAEGSISYATASVEKTIGDDAFTNELTNTGDGDVKYTSNNEDVATVDAATGEVTIVGNGEATITATVTDGTNYTYETKTASYQLKVDRAQEDGYGLWIGEIQVTDANKADVLDNSAFFFDSSENKLIIKNNQEEISIESRLPYLTIFLNDACKLERIYFNNLGDAQNHGSLEITTYSNIPGKVSLATTHADGVISGFDYITIDNDSHTFLLDPIDGIYENGRLLTETGGEVAASATIGQYIKPLVKNQIVTFNPEDFITTDEDGNPTVVDLSNYIVDDILFTLKPETDGEGYDPEDKSICLLSLFNDDWADKVAKAVENEEYIPGGETFAEEFTGITFMVPDGEGTIKLSLVTDANYEFHLKIGTAEPITIVNTDPAKIIEVPYKVTKVTYVYLYMVEATPVAGARPVGKREKAHGRIYTVQVTPKKVEANNPLDEVEGFPAEDIQEVVIADDDTPTGVFKMKDNRPADNDIWYNMEGQKINKPTKKGIYIKNAKKIVI